MTMPENPPQQHIKTSKHGPGRRMTNTEREEAKRVFLETFGKTGNILNSCRKANIDRGMVYLWLEKDEKFSFAYNQAKRDFDDVVLGEAIARAIDGYYTPVVSAGRLVYQADGTPLMQRVVSDSLLAILLRKHHPEYRDKSQVDVNNTKINGQELVIDTRSLSVEQLEKLKTIALEMKEIKV